LFVPLQHVSAKPTLAVTTVTHAQTSTVLRKENVFGPKGMPLVLLVMLALMLNVLAADLSTYQNLIVTMETFALTRLAILYKVVSPFPEIALIPISVLKTFATRTVVDACMFLKPATTLTTKTTAIVTLLVESLSVRKEFAKLELFLVLELTFLRPSQWELV